MQRSRRLKWATHADLAISTTPTVRREEYLDHMTFQRNDRPLFTEIFGPLVGLKEEWEEQGATPSELGFSAFRYRCEARGHVPVNTGRLGGYPEEVLEETDEHRIWRDGLGRTMKLPKGFATLGLPLDFPVRTMDDWLKIKPWYTFSESRFGEDWEGIARQHLAEGKVVSVNIPGGFYEPRELMGEEALCVGYYEQPALIHDILETMGETAFRVLERVTSRVQVDMLNVGEDLAGKTGPLVGPKQVREFIAPYYRRVWEMLRERGTRLFDQDSDGNLNPVIDAFLEAGVNCMHPMEPAANMDVVKIREKYGRRLAFYGGIDKHVLRRSKEDIVKELEYKIPPMVRTGGCVIALDHRIPNETPLENYRFYIQKAWEIMEAESRRDKVSSEERSREDYRHTQVGWLMLAAAGWLVLTVGGPLLLLGWSGGLACVWILLGAAAVLVLLFGWLTVVVRTGEVEIRPGVGFIRKRYRLSQFVEVRAVRNRWWYGWGLRWWPGTIIYNVSGLDAVDLRRLDGTSLRIGTDEPKTLKEALQAAWREAGSAKQN